MGDVVTGVMKRRVFVQVGGNSECKTFVWLIAVTFIKNGGPVFSYD